MENEGIDIWEMMTERGAMIFRTSIVPDCKVIEIESHIPVYEIWGDFSRHALFKSNKNRHHPKAKKLNNITIGNPIGKGWRFTQSSLTITTPCKRVENKQIK